ncbi:MAG: hypothetical protein DMG49_22630 [Acidobacteria bacterium]|nr:MAG: hypothetical protein DMG49_22630 [Acidobacteriota bacterium]
MQDWVQLIEEKLPREIKQKTVELLAQLLREHRKRILAYQHGKERGDEPPAVPHEFENWRLPKRKGRRKEISSW